MGFRGGNPDLFLTGEIPELLELCPEMRSFRDLVFLLKMLLCPAHEQLPDRRRWSIRETVLEWTHASLKLEVRGFGQLVAIDVARREEKPAWIYRMLQSGRKSRAT